MKFQLNFIANASSNTAKESRKTQRQSLQKMRQGKIKIFVHKPSKCGECVTFHNASMITQESADTETKMNVDGET